VRCFCIERGTCESYDVEENRDRPGEEIGTLTAIFEDFISKTKTTNTTRSVPVVSLPLHDTDCAGVGVIFFSDFVFFTTSISSKELTSPVPIKSLVGAICAHWPKSLIFLPHVNLVRTPHRPRRCETWRRCMKGMLANATLQSAGTLLLAMERDTMKMTTAYTSSGIPFRLSMRE